MPVPHSDSDERLVERLRNGDDHAYALLFERHWDKIFQMIYTRTNDKEVAEEIAQEIFMKLWDKRKELVISNLSAYLYTTVKNRCVNYIQGCITRRKFWEYYRVFLPDHENQTDRIVDYNELNRVLEQSLNAIPEKSKLIFKLSRFEGLSIREIASKLNLSEKAIEYHITRSVKELRLYLKDFMLVILLIILP